jgi:methyl-accepting chemotaxis protein
LRELAPAIRRTADLVQEVSCASQEQANGLNQVNKAMGEVNHVVQRHTTRVDELTSASDELAAKSQTLHELMRRFKTNGDDSDVEPNIHLSARSPAMDRLTASHQPGWSGVKGAGTDDRGEAPPFGKAAPVEREL